MNNINIDFSSNISSWAKIANLLLLIFILIFSMVSIFLLYSGSSALVDYLTQHQDNQQQLEGKKLNFISINEKTQRYMQSITKLTDHVSQSGCASPMIHLATVENLLPKVAVVERFDFSLASRTISISIVTNSSKVLVRFLQGVESSGRYSDVRVKQKTVQKVRQYEVQYRCRQ